MPKKSEILKEEAAWLRRAHGYAEVNRYSDEYMEGFAAAISWVELHSTIATHEEKAAPVEYRVRFIFKDSYRVRVITHIDSWYGDTPDGAANYSWLLNNCIVWVEQRHVVEVEEEPWEMADIDNI